MLLLAGGFIQRILKPWMCDPDEGFRSFSNVFAMEIGHTVFGHHVVHITPGSHHA